MLKKFINEPIDCMKCHQTEEQSRGRFDALTQLKCTIIRRSVETPDDALFKLNGYPPSALHLDSSLMIQLFADVYYETSRIPSMKSNSLNYCCTKKRLIPKLGERTANLYIYRI